MQIDLDSAVAVLKRTPRTLRSMLEGLPSGWTDQNEGAETWSPFEVLGHLIHGEKTDWIPRAKIILEAGERRPFDAFDRQAQLVESAGKTVEELLNEFEMLREENLRILEALSLGSSDLARTGIHPELGRVTLGQLIATWVVHDLDHAVQISRTMAKQYGEAVGPWRAYLSVLR
jgi:hypothetical protein